MSFHSYIVSLIFGVNEQVGFDCMMDLVCESNKRAFESQLSSKLSRHSYHKNSVSFTGKFYCFIFLLVIDNQIKWLFVLYFLFRRILFD
jgi:hypothetical protein